jgi:hypothetical protein
MEEACCNDVLFMAISGNSAPHFSTLAHFVSSLGPAIDKIFAQVLTLCDRQGLIGRQMFAIDGVKLPSNASKAKSGKRKDYLRQVDKMERAAPSRNVKLRVIEVRQAAGLEQAFAKAARGAQGVLVLPDPMITAHRQRVASVAAKHRLPAVYYHRDFVDRGGLMAYGPELSTMSRRAADYIDMILRLMLLAFHAPNQPVGLPPDRARWTNSKFDGARSRDA